MAPSALICSDTVFFLLPGETSVRLAIVFRCFLKWRGRFGSGEGAVGALDTRGDDSIGYKTQTRTSHGAHGANAIAQAACLANGDCCGDLWHSVFAPP